MPSSRKRSRRRRGVVVSPAGWQRVRAAQSESESAQNGSNPYTVEQLIELTGLSTNTLGRLRSRKTPIDRQTLEIYFATFDLTLAPTDYTSPDANSAQPEPAQPEPTQPESTQPEPTQPETSHLVPATTAAASQQDWGEAVDVSIFHGRTEELTVLEQWVGQDSCRLIGILGMGGIGKTALSVKLAERIQSQFEFVIWRSLRNAPSLKELLEDIVPFLSRQQDTQATPKQLLHWLRTHRCLLIFDNLETLLQPGHRAGMYQPGYENYGDLLRLLGETNHQSCVLLTSREKPTELSTFETQTGKVRSYQLGGSLETTMSLLTTQNLIGSDAEKRHLCEFYDCSPLVLKIVSASIQSLFDGSIAAFLAEDTMVFNGLKKLLDQQFSRLSEPEQNILYWLAINREWTTVSTLVADIVPTLTRVTLLESLESLTWRVLIEQQRGQYTLQPVLMEYVTDRLVKQLTAELLSLELVLFRQYALLKTTVLNYIGESQRRLVVSPLAKNIQASFHNTQALKQHFKSEN
ncbi:MAG: NB-ARC domain-containing protein, partial [Cyanobacteria bacterium J06597_16]